MSEAQGWHEVTKDEFYRRIGSMDATPYPTGAWPYTSYWKTRHGDVVAMTVDYLPEGSSAVQILPAGIPRSWQPRRPSAFSIGRCRANSQQSGKASHP